MNKQRIIKRSLISILIGIAACVPALSVSAQCNVGEAVKSPISIKNANDFVPSAFTKDGQPMLSFTDFDTQQGTASVQIIDVSISTVAELTVPSDPSTLTEKVSCLAWRNMHWENVERDTIKDVANINEILEAKNYIPIAKYMTNYGESAGEVYGNEDTSFETLPSGIKVIKNFIYGNVEVKCSGECNVEDVIEDNSDAKPTYSIPPLLTLSLLNYNDGTTSIGNVAVTQTLFNDDADFEYVSPIYKSDQYESTKFYTGYVYDFGYFAFEGYYNKSVQPQFCTGFTIRNQRGDILQTVEFGEDLHAVEENFMSLVMFGDKTYLSCCLVSNDSNTYTVMYEVDRADAGVKRTPVFKARVYPTVVSRGENVTVDLGNTDDESVQVAVSDASGRISYSRATGSGESVVSIPSQAMSNGLNIVTVGNDKSGMSSTKVLMK